MSRGHGDKMDRKQEEAIIALLTEPTQKQAAAKAGIGEATLIRWMKEPAFQEKYREAKQQIVAQAVSRLQQSMDDAVLTLKTIMTDDVAPAPSRVAAAKTVLEMGLKATENEEIVARLEQLEQMQETNNNRLKGAR